MNTKAWTEKYLEEVASVKGGKRLPAGHILQDEPTNHPYIKSRDIRGGKVSSANLQFLSENTFQKIKRYIVRTGDVCITIVANIGDVGVVPLELNGANLTENAVKLTNLHKDVNPNFLGILLAHPQYKGYMEQLAAGAAQSKLGIYKIRRVKILLPPLITQRKIAAILTAYDDLIEVNKRRIALLEKMAEEIYREWFVRMRFPGYQDTRFVKGVPEGWEIRELRECADINPSSLGRNDRLSVIHYVDISSVTTNNIGNIQTLQLTDAPGRAKRKVQHGDIIWSSVRPANRAYCLVYEPIENLIVSTGFAVIRPKSRIPFTFLNFVVTSNGFVDQMTAVAKGAAYPATSFDDFEKAKLLLPDEDTLSAFHENCEPLFQQKHIFTEQNRNLTKTRDLLLPRLISGKLSVEHLDIQFPPSMQETAATTESDSTGQG